MGGTTTLDIGNDVNIKGGVLTTDTLTGQVAGDLNAESLQDTYQYDSKQKNAGFSADIDLVTGAGSNLSINGGKTNLDADYAAVTEQTGIYTQKSDLNVGGKGSFKGAAFTTATIDDNQTVFAQGIDTSDIQNHSNYDGEAISVGVSLGQSNGKASANMQGIGYGSDGDSQTSTTKAGVTGMAGQSNVTTATKDSLNEVLVNSFDASTVNEELGAQVDITRAFGQEAPKAVGDVSSYMQLEMIEKGDIDAADKWAEGGAYRVALHTLIGVIATGNVEGALSSGTTAVSIPAVGRYLDEQGVDESTKNALLLGLSAGVGSIVGGDTQSTVNSFNQTQNNYLNHIENARLAELKKEKTKLSNSYGNCVSQRCAEITAEIRKLERLDKARNKYFDIVYDKCRAGNGCKEFYQVHVIQRRQWNASAERLFKQDLKNGRLNLNWVKEDDAKNAFHNFSNDGKRIVTNSDGSYKNTKYTHKNGQFEIIVDPNNNIVKNPNSAGTYNYYPNSNWLGHLDYDVDPWTDFGSGGGDNTSYESRKQGILGKFPGEFGIFDDKEKAWKDFEELDKNEQN